MLEEEKSQFDQKETEAENQVRVFGKNQMTWVYVIQGFSTLALL